MTASRRAAVLTTILPHRPRTGSEIATANIVTALQESCDDVAVLGFLRTGDPPPREGRHDVVGVRPIESRSSRLRTGAWMLEAVLTRQAYSIAKYRSRLWLPRIEALGSRDLVVVDHSQLGFLVPAARRVAPRVVSVLHNVEHAMYEEAGRRATCRTARLAYAREARHLEEAESRLFQRVDEIWCLTAEDAARCAALSPTTSRRVLPLPGLAQPIPPLTQSWAYDVALLASWTWRPNREALDWFLGEVLPRVPAEFTVGVAGAGASELRRRTDLRYEGAVPDAAGFLQRARVVAIPTRSGGGIQIKTLDAIAAGSTIVATSVALRGIDERPPNVRVADTPEGFAEALMAEVARAGSADRDAGRAWALARRDRLAREVRAAVSDTRPGPDAFKDR